MTKLLKSAENVPDDISWKAVAWEVSEDEKEQESYIQTILGNLKLIASGGEGYAKVIQIIEQFTSTGLSELKGQLEKWKDECGLDDSGAFILATVKEALGE